MERSTKSRIATAIALVVSLACLCMLGTFAYRTVGSQAVGVITTGDIDIVLNEYCIGSGGTLVPYDAEQEQQVCAHSSTSLIPVVSNIGERSVWVRVREVRAVVLADGTEGDDACMGVDYDEENWAKKGSYWYYRTPVTPGAQTAPLFTAVTFGEVAQEYLGAKFHVDLTVEALQSDNNGSSWDEALGW